MIMDSNSNNERRKATQRRHVNLGPLPGIGERRINIERRMFNLGLDCGDEWLKATSQDSAAKGSFQGADEHLMNQAVSLFCADGVLSSAIPISSASLK